MQPSRSRSSGLAFAFVVATALSLASAAETRDADKGSKKPPSTSIENIQVGPRPYYLVGQMKDGPLKTELMGCFEKKIEARDFSIAHRGAALQFPEHTKESYEAAARMGAGILECDVTFTKDGTLVCRHAQCDLHTTTDIVARSDLRSHCSVPPRFDSEGNLLNASSIRCCASDIRFHDFKQLCGKMDSVDRSARTVEDYLAGDPAPQTNLYATCGTLISHAESIALFASLDRKFTPELKSGDADDIAGVFGSQTNYAQAMIDEYKKAGVDPDHVWPQSFNLEDVLYWIANEPEFAKQAVFLDDGKIPHPDPLPFLEDLADRGIRIVAPPMPMLLTESKGKIVPSEYALATKEAGLEVISWTTERSGRIIEDVRGRGDAFYYQTTLDALANDGDILTTIDVLAREVGIIGLFSDWPGTTTYYANCVGLE
ncbi:MAG: glycerophosphodiester phosphodiesterase [Deltaproteobacteria bacterium]|jgi:glycerophosphoryl diester phosphodiesterase|nr:glycerophosphodiester phosphodiesterase [Deltaproteobacteria bacterium]MBW2500518.1 glycerophosphodiester phosphodiesterase [Deltaproteobacteria bacterium]